MENGTSCILTFFGTHKVLMAERLLKKNGLAAEAIAAPRHISAECGICIRLRRADSATACQIIEAAGMEINEVYNE